MPRMYPRESVVHTRSEGKQSRMPSPDSEPPPPYAEASPHRTDVSSATNGSSSPRDAAIHSTVPDDSISPSAARAASERVVVTAVELSMESGSGTLGLAYESALKSLKARVEKEERRRDRLLGHAGRPAARASRSASSAASLSRAEREELASLEARFAELTRVEAVAEELEEKAREWAASREASAGREADWRGALAQRTGAQLARGELVFPTSALNQAFYIWHEGEFGTINGLRLGSLPETPVEWREINGAWGAAALLLVSLAREAGSGGGELFSRVRVEPRGSRSKIVRLDTGDVLPLYCSGELWKTNFNAAMREFARCVEELGLAAHADDPSFVMPHAVKNSRVEGVSLDYSSSSELVWTRALKSLLADLKWLGAWAVKRRRRLELALDGHRSAVVQASAA